MVFHTGNCTVPPDPTGKVLFFPNLLKLSKKDRILFQRVF